MPELPGAGPLPALYDSAARSVRPTSPGPSATMYVCGITPYDATHLGHAATYLAFDLVNRAWRDAGRTVQFVQNVTDVDDPLLERAERDGVDWQQLAADQIELFRTDMQALRILPPDALIGAVEAIPSIAGTVQRLVDGGAAYRLDDDVYFPVDSDPRFGYVAGFDDGRMRSLSAENGGDPARPGKKNPLDPVLWRGRRDGEPWWDSPLGPGRPGWHVECTTIALDRLGMGVDIQGGGRDLVFPHHEMSAAHAEVLTGAAPFAKHYVHTGMMGLDGEKMSKSRGNLVFVHRLLDAGTDPAVLRLALLDGHYRADRAWQDADLRTATDRLDRWRQATGRDSGPDARAVLDGVRRALADDLDTRAAMTAVDEWSAAALAGDGDDQDAPSLVRATVDALLGVAL